MSSLQENDHHSSCNNNDNFVLPTMLSGATAGLIGRLICHPIDTCKTRIQVNYQLQGDSLGPSKEHINMTSLRHVIRNTIALEGFRGFYRGLVRRFINLLTTLSHNYYTATNICLHSCMHTGRGYLRRCPRHMLILHSVRTKQGLYDRHE